MADSGTKVEGSGQLEVKEFEKDPIIAEINKRILDAFDIFDHDCNKTVDVREVGTIIRSLGCYPSEAELTDILTEVEEEEPTGFIRLERYQPVMARILMEKRYQPVREEKLLEAFEVLDEDRNSFLQPESLKQLLMEEGEPFSLEEAEEMLTAAVDPEKRVVYYKDYVTLMLPEQQT